MTESTSLDTEAGDQAESNQSSQSIESFSCDDSIVRLFLTATLVWGLVSAFVGLATSLLLVMPQLSIAPIISYGRLQPLYIDLAIFAFGGNAIFAAVYYSTQRLCKARMWSGILSQLHFWGWQLILVASSITLPLGITQAKQFAEFEWPIDIAIAIVWIVFFGFNFLMTLQRRRERLMYVSLWFYIATIVLVAILHVANSLAVPVTAFKSVPMFAGAQDAMLQAWYSQNLMLFFLAMPFLGLMYYFLPKAAERPVFSYKLCIVQFWSLVLLGVWVGPHELLYTSIAAWASLLGMAFSLMLWMPSWAAMVNGLLTLRGAWGKVASEPVLKFFVAGLLFFGVWTFINLLVSLRSVNAFSGYTELSVAHLHTGLFGWCGFMTFGMIYWLLPRIFQTNLSSKKLANVHFWISTLGILLYLVPTYIAGVTQGAMWQEFTPDGYPAHLQFIDSVNAIKPMWWISLVGGLVYFGGIVLMAVNYFRTWSSRPKQYEALTIQAAPLSKQSAVDPVVAESQIDGVLNIGHKFDVWQQGKWHRVWEQSPMRFVFLTIAAVIVAAAFELGPMFLIESNVPTIATVKPYSPLELAGRDIYIAEGCCNCHSQQVRPLLADTERYGDFSQAGEFIYDHPQLWGSRRVGPDLAREGGRQSHVWHFKHFNKPSEVTAGSVMPAFPHLIQTQLDFNSIQSRVQVAHNLGVGYDQGLADASEMAKKQARRIAWELAQQDGPLTSLSSSGQVIDMADTKLIALIAYLQRLGTDLQAAEEETADVPPLTEAQQNLFDKYDKMLTYESIMAADVLAGKKIYGTTCGKCHQLFDEGGNIGPALTGTQRWNKEYLLENIVAPSREILAAYKTEEVLTIDGIVVTGLIAKEDDEILVLLTADQKRVEIYQEDIEDRKTSKLSLMPEGQLETLKPDEVRSLFKYLQLPKALDVIDKPVEVDSE
ncbi:cytochrome-c oxidase, cbb3-type subunit II [Mariniblastus sp.]|nr:cytochrome-c oxidase, cbb3-type subunit II [Mariniblastus sp.]